VWLTELGITGWRNHHKTNLAFNKGATTFIGANGQGKTNIVEAIRYMATLGSHRVSATAPLIHDNHDEATIHARLQHGTRSVEAGVTLKRKGSSLAVLNGNKVKVSEIPAWVSMVMFAPEDSAIVRGEPGTRRTFMDELVVSGSPGMVATYQDFDKVLRQRNTLLKNLRSNQSGTSLSTLEVWDERLSDLSATIMIGRQRYLSFIGPFVTVQYQELAGGDNVELTYKPVGNVPSDALDAQDFTPIREKILGSLRGRRSEEIDRGMTLSGPHRDDLDLSISGRLARTHASQGETWSFALALRLGTALWLRQELSSGDPIIILDDVFSELDAGRRRKLVGLVQHYEQLIITGSVHEDVPEHLTGEVFDVSEGVVKAR
jgi:DNA replication and repair protein RecF